MHVAQCHSFDIYWRLCYKKKKVLAEVGGGPAWIFDPRGQRAQKLPRRRRERTRRSLLWLVSLTGAGHSLESHRRRSIKRPRLHSGRHWSVVGRLLGKAKEDADSSAQQSATGSNKLKRPQKPRKQTNIVFWAVFFFFSSTPPHPPPSCLVSHCQQDRSSRHTAKDRSNDRDGPFRAGACFVSRWLGSDGQARCRGDALEMCRRHESTVDP